MTAGAFSHNPRPIEALRDAIYRGDWEVALGLIEHRDPLVREYAHVVRTISPTIRIFWSAWAREGPLVAEALGPLTGAVLSTARGEHAERVRQWMIADWLVREWGPTWLSLSDDLVEEVALLRAMPPLGPGADERLEEHARAVRDRVWQTCRGVTRGGQGRRARDLADEAARLAGLPAAWEALFGPTRGYLAAPGERGAHLGVCVMNAARDVAWDAALNVARTTALACVAAGGLRAKPLAATVKRLQQSAVDLVSRLAEVD